MLFLIDDEHILCNNPQKITRFGSEVQWHHLDNRFGRHPLSSARHWRIVILLPQALKEHIKIMYNIYNVSHLKIKQIYGMTPLRSLQSKVRDFIFELK